MRNIDAMPKGPSPSLSMTGGNWLLLGLLALLWGSGFFFTTIAVEDIGPSTVVLIRVILAAGLLYAVIRMRGSRVPAGWASWRPFFVLGLVNTTLPFTLNAWSLTRIESGVAGILTATVPIFTVVVAHFATTDEHFSGAKIVGIGLGMVGVMLILGQDLVSLASGDGLGKLAVLVACLCYGIAGAYARSLKGVPPLHLAFGQLCTAAVFLTPFVAVVDRPWRTATWSTEAVLAVLVLTVFGSACAYLIYYRLLTTAGATNASLVAYLIPIVAVLLGASLLDERLVVQQVLGMALIIGGMAVIDGRLVKRLVNRHAHATTTAVD